MAVYLLQDQVAARRAGRLERGVVRIAMAAWLTLALLLVGLSVVRASDRDETVLTVKSRLER